MSNSKASPPDNRQNALSRLILIEDFETFGANPHEVGIGSLNAAGHEKMPILRAIRRKCIDCSGGNQPEVRKCTVIGCALLYCGTDMRHPTALNQAAKGRFISGAFPA